MKLPFLAIVAGLLLWLQAAVASAAWTPLTPLGNTTVATSNPSCATVAANEAVCAVSDANHKLAVNRFVGGAWTGWTVLAGTIASDPSCTERGTREVVCVA